MIKSTLLLTLALTVNLQASPPQALIPLPSEVTRQTGPAFPLKNHTLIVYDAKLTNEATLLAEQLRTSTGFSIPIVSEASLTPKQREHPIIRLDLKSSLPVPSHGYSLNCSAQGIDLIAKDATGIFYGTRTLLQLLPAQVMADSKQSATWSVPAYHITDAPRFQWRGMHLDESRHFFGKSFVKRYINLLANHKMNVFHWHLIDDGGWRIEIKKYPKLTEQGAWRKDLAYNTQKLTFPRIQHPKTPTSAMYGGFYTQEDIKEIVAYAKARHVRVIPEIEIPGHSLPALDAYPEHRCGGSLQNDGEGWTPQRQNSYCPGKESTYTFLKNVLTEVFTLFPDQYVHIGGDEVIKKFWDQCPDCKKRMKDQGLRNANELQSYLIRRIETFLNQNDKKLIGWDEITHGGLTPNATVMFWIGTGAIPQTIEKGHEVIMTPMSPCYFDYGYPSNETSKVYQWEPVPEAFLGTPQEKQFLGAQGNVWTENMLDAARVEFMILPRMLAMAEILWSPRKNRDLISFSQRLYASYPRLDVQGLHYRLPSPLPTSSAYLFKKNAKVTFASPPSGFQLHYTRDGSAPTLKSPRYTAPITIHSNTTIRARLVKGQKRGPVVSVDCKRYTPTKKLSLEPGLYAQYAEGKWNRIPNFRTLDNVIHSKVAGPDLSIRKRNDYFACQFTGYIKIKQAGIHHFTLASDDGSILKLGGVTVINHDGPHGYSKKSGSIFLQPGVYPIDIGFLEVGGLERLDIALALPGSQLAPLPDALLFREKNKAPTETVKLTTNLPIHKDHPTSLAMDDDTSTYFWSSRGPKVGETWTATFKNPIKGLNLTVKTGKPDGGDHLQHGVLEVSSDGKRWRTVATFFGGKAETALKQNTLAIRIRVTQTQAEWLAIREISLGHHPRTLYTIKKSVEVGKRKVDLALTVDTEGSDDLKPLIKKMSQLYFTRWPQIAQLINSPIDSTPKHLFLSFKEEMGFPAYVSGTNMVIEGNHLRRNPDDTFGVFTHELTHFVQSYPPGAPGWFAEGTADYIRYQFLPQSKWAKRVSSHTDTSKPLGAYWNSTAFLLWIEKTQKPDIVATVSRMCKDGHYNDFVWETITGHSLKKLTQMYSHQQ